MPPIPNVAHESCDAVCRAVQHAPSYRYFANSYLTALSDICTFALRTTAGNPVATAAGNAVLKTIEAEGLIEHSARIGKLFSDGLRALGDRHEIVGDVRGRGLAIGVDLVLDRKTRGPVPATTTAKIIYRGYELVAAFTHVGLKANVLEFMPPLTLGEDEVAEGVAIVDQAIAHVAAGKVSDADVASFMMR